MVETLDLDDELYVVKFTDDDGVNALCVFVDDVEKVFVTTCCMHDRSV